MSWPPGWEAQFVPPSRAEKMPLGSAAPARLFANAADAGSLALARRAYERELRDSPRDYEILVALSEIEILHGAAYATSRREKAAFYIRGIQLAEAAMATDPEFRDRIEAGVSLGEAVGELGPEEMKAMLLWVTGVSYYFKECLRGIGHVVNFRWMARARDTMEQMMRIDPEFEQGAVLFSLGIYYLALPPSAGGDRDRAAELMDRAVAVAGTHLLPRWGRAKYLHVANGDRSGFRDDLRWVLSRDPRAAASPFPWNVYMQRDAAEMLSRTGELFSDRR